MDDDILLGLCVVAHEVVLPRCDALTDEREVVLACAFLLVHTDGEVAHLTGHIGKVFVLLEVVGSASDGNGEKRRSGLDRLRHDDGAPLVAGLCWQGGCPLYTAFGSHDASAQINGRFSDKVAQQHCFCGRGPLSAGKA